MRIRISGIAAGVDELEHRESSLLKVEGVSLTYPGTRSGKIDALENVDLAVAHGEFVSIIGPSGCGKSSLLQCIGGLVRPDSGAICHGGRPVAGPDPSRSAFVFQDPSLFPWRTVLDNVALALRFSGIDRKRARERAQHVLEFVGLGGFLDAYPHQLSGGMAQRVGVARALSVDPEMLLLDEPFGALDEQMRRSLGIDIVRLLERTGRSVLLVTHSLEEAIFWADRIIVMSGRPGRVLSVLEVDSPRGRTSAFMEDREFDSLRRSLFHLLDAARPTDQVEARSDDDDQ